MHWLSPSATRIPERSLPYNMIARISGTLVQKSASQIVVDAGGVGYGISIPLTTFYELPEKGQPVAVHVHTHVKQDSIALFGFFTEREKSLFELMIGVTGIGPKVALSILSGISAADFITSVSQENLARLVTIPGVGKKTAERIVLELKDKMRKIAQDLPEGRDAVMPAKPDDLLREDALSALVNLGYRTNAVKEVLDKLLKELPPDATIDVLLKKALRALVV